MSQGYGGRFGGGYNEMKNVEPEKGLIDISVEMRWKNLDNEEHKVHTAAVPGVHTAMVHVNQSRRDSALRGSRVGQLPCDTIEIDVSGEECLACHFCSSACLVFTEVVSETP